MNIPEVMQVFYAFDDRVKNLMELFHVSLLLEISAKGHWVLLKFIGYVIKA